MSEKVYLRASASMHYIVAQLREGKEEEFILSDFREHLYVYYSELLVLVPCNTWLLHSSYLP